MAITDITRDMSSGEFSKKLIKRLTKKLIKRLTSDHTLIGSKSLSEIIFNLDPCEFMRLCDSVGLIAREIDIEPDFMDELRRIK